MRKCYLNRWELYNFPRSIQTIYLAWSWLVALEAGFVVGSLYPWLGVWLIVPWILIYIWLVRHKNNYSLWMLFPAILGLFYWKLLENPINWKLWLLTVLWIAMIIICWLIASRKNIYFYKRKDFTMYDKLMHFGGFGALTLYAYPIFCFFGSPIFALLFAAGFSLIFGIIYEIRNCFYANGFSLINLLADALGIAIASSMILLKII